VSSPLKNSRGESDEDRHVSDDNSAKEFFCSLTFEQKVRGSRRGAQGGEIKIMIKIRIMTRMNQRKWLISRVWERKYYFAEFKRTIWASTKRCPPRLGTRTKDAGLSGFWGADDYNGEQMAAPVAQMDRAAVS
jgi:hypothetical protein